MKKPHSGCVLIHVIALVAIVAVVVAWHAVHLRSAQQQRDTVERIRALGGVAIYDYMLDERYRPVAKTDPFLSTWICRVLGEDYFYGIKGVVLVSDSANDEDMKRMNYLSRLSFLVLCSNSVTDSGAKYLGRIKTLKYAVVSGVGITPKCITLLHKQLPRCELHSDY
jgi:hypothetical protein